MFGHKSFLRIGALNDSSILGLYKDSYELEVAVTVSLRE